jgi:hypothetical protein
LAQGAEAGGELQRELLLLQQARFVQAAQLRVLERASQALWGQLDWLSRGSGRASEATQSPWVRQALMQAKVERREAEALQEARQALAGEQAAAQRRLLEQDRTLAAERRRRKAADAERKLVLHSLAQVARSVAVGVGLGVGNA